MRHLGQEATFTSNYRELTATFLRPSLPLSSVDGDILFRLVPTPNPKKEKEKDGGFSLIEELHSTEAGTRSSDVNLAHEYDVSLEKDPPVLSVVNPCGLSRMAFFGFIGYPGTCPFHAGEVRALL